MLEGAEKPTLTPKSAYHITGTVTPVITQDRLTHFKGKQISSALNDPTKRVNLFKTRPKCFLFLWATGLWESLGKFYNSQQWLLAFIDFLLRTVELCTVYDILRRSTATKCHRLAAAFVVTIECFECIIVLCSFSGYREIKIFLIFFINVLWHPVVGFVWVSIVLQNVWISKITAQRKSYLAIGVCNCILSRFL